MENSFKMTYSRVSIYDCTQDRRASLGLQRLYAIDLWARMVDCIHPVWYYNLQRMRRNNSSACGSPYPRGQEPFAAQNNGSVVVSNNTVYVSVAPPPRGNLDGESCEEDEEGTLWAIRDNGDTPELIYQTSASVSALSLYDVDLGVTNRRGQRQKQYCLWGARSGQKTDKTAQATWSKREDDRKTSPSSKRNNRQVAKKPNSHLQDRTEALWAATSQKITGYSTKDGSVQYSVDVCKDILKTSDPCRITSSLMVTHSDDDKYERLVFAASVVINTSLSSSDMPGSSPTTIPYILALDVVDAESTRELWRVAGKAGTEFVGQITNVVWATNKKDLTNSVESLVRVDQKHSFNDGGAASEDWGSNVLRFEPSVETADDRVIFLVATAVSDSEQIAVAIGYL